MGSPEVLDVHGLHNVFLNFGEVLRAHAPRLDALNVFPVPDADTGRNMADTIAAALAVVDATGTVARLCETFGEGAFFGAKGNSGTILAQLLSGFLAVLAEEQTPISAWAVSAALQRAAHVGPAAVLEVAPGTMLTVAADVAAAAMAATATVSVSLTDLLDACQHAGYRSLAKTVEQNPVLARARVVDSGAAGYLLLLDSFLFVAAQRPLPESLIEETVEPDSEHKEAGEPDWEVMFTLIGSRSQREVITALAAVGDSVVVTGSVGAWTCHVHADDIGAVLEAVLDLGRPRRIRVESLRMVDG